MRIFSRIACLALAVTAAALPVAGQAASRSSADAVRLLDRGTITADEQLLREGRQTLLDVLAQRLEPREAVTAHYSIAYADWRIAMLPEMNASKMAPVLEDAVRQLQEALKVDGHYAEAEALLASVYGVQIGVEPARAMFLVPLISNALEHATSLQPDNPRVVLLQGINAYFTPPAYGGGPEKAQPLFARALELFDRESRPSDWPNWGRLDALAYLGQIQAARGDRKAARTAYEKALELAPDDRHVRVLMSKVDGSGQ